MENERKAVLKSFLKALPSVDFCCVYGSALHPNNHDKVSPLDYLHFHVFDFVCKMSSLFPLDI